MKIFLLDNDINKKLKIISDNSVETHIYSTIEAEIICQSLLLSQEINMDG